MFVLPTSLHLCSIFSDIQNQPDQAHLEPCAHKTADRIAMDLLPCFSLNLLNKQKFTKDTKHDWPY